MEEIPVSRIGESYNKANFLETCNVKISTTCQFFTFSDVFPALLWPQFFKMYEFYNIFQEDQVSLSVENLWQTNSINSCT